MTGNIDKGVSPLGTQVSYGGAMGYFQPPWVVREQSGDQVIMNYKAVQNTDFVSTTVKLLISYTVGVGVEYEEVSGLSVTVGNTVINLPDLVIEEVTTPAAITVNENSLFFYPNNKLFGNGEAEVQMEVNVPSTAGQAQLEFRSIFDEVRRKIVEPNIIVLFIGPVAANAVLLQGRTDFGGEDVVSQSS